MANSSTNAKRESSLVPWIVAGLAASAFIIAAPLIFQDSPTPQPADLTVHFRKGWRGPHAETGLAMTVAEDGAKHSSGTTCYLYANATNATDALITILGRATAGDGRWLVRWTADADHEARPPSAHARPICASGTTLLIGPDNLAKLRAVAQDQVSPEQELEQKNAVSPDLRARVLREAESARQHSAK